MDDYRQSLQQQLDASDSFDSHQDENMINFKVSGLPENNNNNSSSSNNNNNYF